MKKQDKPSLSDNDSELFRRSMKDVTPLAPSNKIYSDQSKKPNSPRAPQITAKDSEYAIGYFPNSSNNEIDDKIQANTPLFFQRSGVQHSLMKRLKKGLIPREITIDLHGLNVNQANVQLFNFLETYNTSMQTCICLIHGKGSRSHLGQPVLKQKINTWLKQHPRVIAFCSALSQDGGTGATYVLIKRNN